VQKLEEAADGRPEIYFCFCVSQQAAARIERSVETKTVKKHTPTSLSAPSPDYVCSVFWRTYNSIHVRKEKDKKAQKPTHSAK
jgi:hypothetical protein